MTKTENDILSILTDLSENKISIDHSFMNLIAIINEILKNNIPNIFNINDYILVSNDVKEYKSKDNIMKKTTIFLNGNEHFRLIPKDDIESIE